jgi:hypothetical protein
MANYGQYSYTADYAQPGMSVASVTPNDSADLARAPCRALWVGGSGNIAVVMKDGTTATITGVLQGTLLPLMVQRVNATSTTATNIVAVY